MLCLSNLCERSACVVDFWERYTERRERKRGRGEGKGDRREREGKERGWGGEKGEGKEGRGGERRGRMRTTQRGTITQDSP